MSRLFESFNFMNSGWAIRLLESQSLRSIFLMLMIDVFMLGMVCTILLYDGVRFHRFDLSNAMFLVLFVLPVFRYSSVVYRRLGSDR